MPAASQIAGAKRRAAVALEIAKGLALSNDRRFWQVKLTIAGAGGGDAPLDLFASDNPEGIEDVVERRAAMALVNPSVMLTLAHRGTGPFREPQPVRAIAVNPSYDLFAFVVTADTGLTSLEDVRDRRFPLRISLRGQRSHSIHSVLDCVLAAAGFSVKVSACTPFFETRRTSAAHASASQITGIAMGMKRAGYAPHHSSMCQSL